MSFAVRARRRPADDQAGVRRHPDLRRLRGRAATLDDVGNVAAFAASDYASSMTATALNITGGAVID